MSTITATQALEPSQEDADKALLMRIAKDGDVAAMEELYVRLRPRMVGFLGRMTQDEGLIEEAYNDVMIKVWDNAAQFEGRAKVSSWVFSIAYRTCLRLVKKQQRRSATVLLMGDDMPDVEIDDPPEAEANQELATAVTHLSPRHRLVVELCYFEGCSLEEISRIVGCPLNTVKTRLHHARKKLKLTLAAAG
ncbi:MAG: RNA polymerase sigma factor [Pseudomonadota bacterium]